MNLQLPKDASSSAAEPANNVLVELVAACTSPSEAFWRSFEVAVLEGRDFPRPLLEIGCGDGAFTALLGIAVDEGLDLNPRAVERARARSETYGSVRCMDIREFPDDAHEYATIFANSVLEHISDVESVLRACHRLLEPWGRLIFTVPLVDMNSHLLIKTAWYAEFRRRQLQHRNLWSIGQWRAALRAVGFEEIETVRYLPSLHCRFWDCIDVFGDLGIGRYRVAAAVGRLGSVILPKRQKTFVRKWVARRLQRQLRKISGTEEHGCAALLIATKRGRASAE